LPVWVELDVNLSQLDPPLDDVVIAVGVAKDLS
jgi:hypothetical protein